LVYSPSIPQAVLSHELGHLKCDHGLWLTVANVLASGTVSVLPIIRYCSECAGQRHGLGPSHHHFFEGGGTMVWIMVSNFPQLYILFSDMVEEALMRWLRAAELTCDRAALLVAQVGRRVTVETHPQNNPVDRLDFSVRCGRGRRLLPAGWRLDTQSPCWLHGRNLQR